MTNLILRYTRKSLILITLTLLCVTFAVPARGDKIDPSSRFPVPEKFTLLNVYADFCFACRMLKPILEKIKEDCRENLAVVDLDAEQNLELMREMNVKAVPVLFFYNLDGSLHLRHEGFMREESIRAVLEEMGLR